LRKRDAAPLAEHIHRQQQRIQLRHAAKKVVAENAHVLRTEPTRLQQRHGILHAQRMIGHDQHRAIHRNMFALALDHVVTATEHIQRLLDEGQAFDIADAIKRAIETGPRRPGGRASRPSDGGSSGAAQAMADVR
jgi:hypothetical protein